LSPLVFPSLRSTKRPMSENTINAALRRLGYAQDEMTAHGFRAMASTLLNEMGNWNPDAIERQFGPVPVLFRSGAHVKRPFVRRPQGFSSLVLNVGGAGCRSR
jgi:integrase